MQQQQQRRREHCRIFTTAPTAPTAPRTTTTTTTTTTTVPIGTDRDQSLCCPDCVGLRRSLAIAVSIIDDAHPSLCLSLSLSHTHRAQTIAINPNDSNNASDPSKGNDALTGIFRDGPSVDAFSWPLPICSQHTQQQTKHQSRGIIFRCSVSLVPTQDHHVRNITSVVVKYGSSIDPNQHDTPNHEAKSSSSSFMISAVVATDDYLD